MLTTFYNPFLFCYHNFLFSYFFILETILYILKMDKYKMSKIENPKYFSKRKKRENV